MRATLLLLAVLVVGSSGFLLLAFSQPRNWQIAAGTTATQPSKMRLRLLAIALLGLSLILALYRDGPAFGTILWVVCLGVSAGAVIAALSLRWIGLSWLARLVVIGKF